MPQPCDSHDVTDVDVAAGPRSNGYYLAHHFVAGSHVWKVHRQVAFGDVQVRAAHSAGPNGDEHLAVIGILDGCLDQLEWMCADRAWRSYSPRAHRPWSHDSMVLLGLNARTTSSVNSGTKSLDRGRTVLTRVRVDGYVQAMKVVKGFLTTRSATLRGIR